MDYTARMAALLGRMRRERNGAVADAMYSYGRACGLNYGVSLPTVRQIARTETPDHDFAHFLFLQDVRELRLAALHIAEPARFTTDESAFWAAGICNSELAEELAFALAGRAESLAELFRLWIDSPNPLLTYAVLLSAARQPRSEWITPVVEAVRRTAAADQSAPKTPVVPSRLVAQGAVAFLCAAGAQNAENRHAVLRAAGSLGGHPSEDYVHEELAWRLEV